MRHIAVPALIVILLIGALLPLSMSEPSPADRSGDQAPAPEPPPTPQRVELQVEPATLTLGGVKEFVVRAPGVEGGEGLTLFAPDVGLFQQSVSAADLKAGVVVKLTGHKVGTYRLQAKRNNAEVGSATVAVARLLTAELGADLDYDLQAGEVISHPGGGLTVPVVVVARDKDKKETRVAANATVTILDSNSKAVLGSGRLSKESALSQPIPLSLEQESSYTLTGSVKYDDTASEYPTNPLNLKYEAGSFRLGLDARPLEKTVDATACTPAIFTVYLTHKGARFYPKKPITVSTSADKSGVRINPAHLIIDPADGSAPCKIASTWSQNAKIEFALGSPPPPPIAVKVTFESVSWFYVLACFGALAGRVVWLLATLVVSREQALAALSQQSGEQNLLQTIAELLVSLCGGFVVALAFLHGWFWLIGLAPQNIDWSVAVVVGMIGGIAAVGTLKVASPNLSLPG
jgi:hypothetical protein